jgi:hypothetical protein
MKRSPSQSVSLDALKRKLNNSTDFIQMFEIMNKAVRNQILRAGNIGNSSNGNETEEEEQQEETAPISALDVLRNQKRKQKKRRKRKRRS